MIKLILIGGGGHCKSCIDVIEQVGQYEITGILDKPELLGRSVLNYKIIGNDDNIPELAKKGYSFLITVGQVRSPELRKNLFKLLRSCSANMATVISPSAYVSPHAEVGEGSIVMHHALINADAKIGNNCIVNTKALVEHDAIVEDHCHISTAAVLNGGAQVREGTFFGSNATTQENATSATSDFIKAGTLLKAKQ